MTGYVELQTITNYSFLRGASHPVELFEMAQLLGFEALGVADHNTLAGIVQAHQKAQDHRVRLVAGCRLNLTDSDPVLVFPKDRTAYVRLCHLLTLGKSRGETNDCLLSWKDLSAASDGMMAIMLPNDADERTAAQIRRMANVFGDRGSIALTRRFRPNDDMRLYHLCEMGKEVGVAPVVTGDVLYHHQQRRILQDVMTCIRHLCTMEELGFRREMFAERQLKAPELMQSRFKQYPAALARSVEIASACTFSLSELQYQYPDETEDSGETAQQTLKRLVVEMTPFRYPDGLPDAVKAQLKHELALIGEMDYAPYFLTVNSIVRYARGQGILCQGRGSAANSAVCYVLGVTSIDPVKSGLLFERFISAERREPPDIDVDFESERREEVIQWIYEHYGRECAALVATVQRYRAKGAIRDVGKVLGLTEDVTSVLARQVWGGSDDAVTEEQAASVGVNLGDRRVQMTLEIARDLINFPRQFGTHPGGFVLTNDRLADLVPIKPAAMKDRQVIEWDKDDIDVLKFMKVDVLGLGMLGCLRRCFDLLEERTGQSLDIATIPAEDRETYKMIQRADTIGTFQIESRAQMSMLPRMKPATFYDLVIEVAIVRPGPIQGDMVHPYLRRREGKEKPDYPTPALRRVLEKTLGVPLFQEQAMQLAIVCAGFTPGEADQLRRSMATFKFTGGVSHFKEKLIAGMVANEYSHEFAEKMFSQLEGFGSYGFPESHAASFALIAYASCWVKRHHPAIFCCSLLNSQPMGFYAPAQLVRDVREHGVEVRPICINRSRWDCTIEADRSGRPVLRLGLRMVKGLSDTDGVKLVTRRGGRLYQSVEDLWRRAEITRHGLEMLAEADAYQSLEADRRRALWIIKGLADTELPLFAAMRGHNQQEPESIEPTVFLPTMAAGRHVVEDYRSTGLTLRQHPVTFLREELGTRKAVTCADLATIRDGRKISVAGLMLVRQKPGSAKGVMFITIEDETGVANLIVWPEVFEKQRSLILSAGMLMCHGKLQKEAGIIHVIVDRLEDCTPMLRSVGQMDADFNVPIANADEVKSGGPPGSRSKPPSNMLSDRPTTITIRPRDFR